MLNLAIDAQLQNRTSQDLLLFKDGQLQDAQAWMARAQELDAYHINANNTLHAELRERSDQLNQVWMGYQRQVDVLIDDHTLHTGLSFSWFLSFVISLFLGSSHVHQVIIFFTWLNDNLMIFQLADIERFHAQVVQRLQAEVNEAREHSQMFKGPGTERLTAKEERQIHTGNQIDVVQREPSEETGAKVTPTNNSGVRGNPIVLSHGTMEATVPVYIPLDNSVKVGK